MKKTVALLLSILMLASTSGVAYAQHFCGDYQMLAKVTIGEAHLSCGMVMEDSCGDEKENNHTDHDCCNNQYTQVDTDDNFAPSHNDSIIVPQFVKAFVSVFVLKAHIQEPKIQVHYFNYKAPPLIKDIPVFFETFLI